MGAFYHFSFSTLETDTKKNKLLFIPYSIQNFDGCFLL